LTDSLLSRLQALTEPSREIDEEIAAAFGWVCIDEVECLWLGPAGERQQVPHYTASIDAALTLLGNDYAIDDTMIWPGQPARITIVGVRFWKGEYWHEAKDGRWEAQGATAAIALLIAIMKTKEDTTP
jgi:hypothetical protein